MPFGGANAVNSHDGHAASEYLSAILGRSSRLVSLVSILAEGLLWLWDKVGFEGKSVAMYLARCWF